jgi:transposase
VHNRLSRWSESGGWERILKVLIADADNEYVMIDSTIVRAHQHSAGAQKNNGTPPAIGRSKGGLTTKIHALGDALGNPIGFHLTAGQAHDLEGADVLIERVEAQAFLADRADDADDRVIKRLTEKHCQPVIPPKSNRKQQRFYDKFLYQARHLIENFLAKLKQYRAIATRYDKTARNFLGAIYLAASVIGLN